MLLIFHFSYFSFFTSFFRYYIPTLQATIIVPRCGTRIVASFIAMLKATIFVLRIRGMKIVASWVRDVMSKHKCHRGSECLAKEKQNDESEQQVKRAS